MNPIDAIFKGLAELVAFYYAVVPNYALAIALLTVTVMVVLAPLTWKSTRSMIAMQTLQPEMKRIQQQHKNDRVKLNEEMMALYKEHNVNPLTSCLPQFLQLPVLFIMYRVIRGLGHIPKGAKTFAPQYISKSSKLYSSLAGKTHMSSLGLDLANSASKALHVSVGTALPYLLLVAVVIVTQIISTRQMMGRNPSAAQNQQAQLMNKLMPALFGVWSYLFPAGLNVYFLVSNAMRIGQQSLMYRLDPTLAAGGKPRKGDAGLSKGDAGPPKKPIDASSAPTGPAEGSDTPPSSGTTAKKSFFERLREAATAPAAPPARPAANGASGSASGNGSESPAAETGEGITGHGSTGQGSTGTGNGSADAGRGNAGGRTAGGARPQGARSGGGNRSKKKRRGR